MELDELKKSWNALNEQLQKEPIADEQQITELIAGYKANTRKSLGRLVVIQRFSIGMGAVGLAALLLIWLLLPTFGFNEQLQGKIVALLGFIAISILIGMWWDWKTYRWNKDTRIDEMGVAEVSRRMTTFRQWTRYELKKSWNALNEQLQKEPIADEQQITELIAGYKANTRKSLGRLVVIQRFSIGMGAVGLAALLLIWLLLPTFGFNEQLQGKIVALLGFIAISILIGMWWDWKTYRWNKDTRIDEMGVAEVSRRMTTFRQWTRYEVMGISIWIILFNILNYWVMEYHLAPASVQALLITLFVVFDALIIYILYKKVIYKHLDNIKKNIEELKDICTE